MMFYLVSYDTSYCERKHQEMQRISNSQEIQTKSIFEIFVSLNLIKSKQEISRLKFLENKVFSYKTTAW